jgi:hypothetical protein
MSVVVAEKPAAAVRRGSLKEGRVEKKRQRQFQKLQSKRNQQKQSRQANADRLSKSMGSTSGLLARQKCILLIGDASDETFQKMKESCSRQLNSFGLGNRDVIVEVKLSSMFDDLNSSSNIPPQRNISHAFVLIDAAEFIGSGEAVDAVATVEALERLYKARLPTNSKFL